MKTSKQPYENQAKARPITDPRPSRSQANTRPRGGPKHVQTMLHLIVHNESMIFPFSKSLVYREMSIKRPIHLKQSSSKIKASPSMKNITRFTARTKDSQHVCMVDHWDNMRKSRGSYVRLSANDAHLIFCNKFLRSVMITLTLLPI